MPIRAITIDFWSTLYVARTDGYSTRRRQRILRQYLRAHGFRVPMHRIHEAIMASRRRAEAIWFDEQRTATARERLSWILSDLGVELPQPVLDQLICDLEEALLREKIVLIDGAREAVQALAERWPLGLISDTGMTPGRILRRFMARDGILHLFQHCTFSDETGRAKPHPEQFLRTLERLGCRPEEAVHVGDLTATDIVGARQVGMKAVQFVGETDGEDTSLADAVVSSYHELLTVLEQLDR